MTAAPAAPRLNPKDGARTGPGKKISEAVRPRPVLLMLRSG